MFKIAGKDFYEYVAYRLKKDGLGFLPAEAWEDGATDAKSYIKAVVPNTPYDFLVYAHELGHCKSKQGLSVLHKFFSFEMSPETITNEFNAWVWALRYIRKLKVAISDKELTDALDKSFKTYTKRAKYPAQANHCIRKLNEMFGTNLKEEEFVKTSMLRNNTSFTLYWSDDWVQPTPKPKKVEKVVPINKKHKPWMDMLDNQRKKHQRHSRKFT